MKTSFLTFLAFVILAFSACSDDNVTDMGSSIQPSGDKIIVATESFAVGSENYNVPYIYSYPDSFLLGTFHDTKYGTIHADIFAQVEHPANHFYPVDVTPDSMLLVLYYRRFFGDKYSPMHLSVYEMNQQTFRFSTPYPSNLNPADYTDKSILLGRKSFTAVDATKMTDSTSVVIKLSDEFLQRFTAAGPDIFTSETKFQNFFKGLHITPEFGSATMLYIKQIDMEYYHHYTYQSTGTNGQDTTIKVNNIISFPANKMVRQVNRFLHPDKNEVIARLGQSSPQQHIVSSPANIYTRLQLPLRNIQDKLEGNGRRLAINSASLRVDISEVDQSSLAQTMPNNLLLIRESSIDRFFGKKELPNDSVAIMGTYTVERNPDTNEFDYYYSFNIAGLIANELKKSKLSGQLLPDTSPFVLVPIRAGTDASGNLIEVGHEYLLRSVTINGGSHPTKPITIRTVFTGF